MTGCNAEERWLDLISETNWAKGEVIANWMEETGGTFEQFTQAVGGITSTHAERLLTVYLRFSCVRSQWPNLRWPHYFAAIEWRDSAEWLTIADRGGMSVHDMRFKHFASTGS